MGNRPSLLRIAAAVVLGAATWFAVLGLGFVILRASWPAYVAAEPEKAYTLAMLGFRLLIFSSTIAAVSAVAAWVGRDERGAWLAGAVILALSIPSHLYPGYVWDDYPVWYHLLYLASILPIAWVAGRATNSLADQAPGGRVRSVGGRLEQPVPGVSEADVARVIERDFAGEDRERVAAQLGEGEEPLSPRVALAVLKNSEGDASAVAGNLEAARMDYRDVLAYAEYPEYMSTVQYPGNVTEEREQQAIRADWDQYQAWLNR